MPALPQLPNQEPPRPQQLALPDFGIMPHSGQAELMAIVVTDAVGIRKMVKRKKVMIRKSGYSVSKHTDSTLNFRLTFADLHALKPALVRFPAASTSTILVPTTARSATTDSTRFLERAAVWTHDIACRRKRCAYWCACYLQSC